MQNVSQAKTTLAGVFSLKAPPKDIHMHVIPKGTLHCAQPSSTPLSVSAPDACAVRPWGGRCRGAPELAPGAMAEEVSWRKIPEWGVGFGAWGGLRETPPAPPHSRSRMQLHGGAVQRFFGGSRHPQVSSLMKSTVLMRQPRRVQEIVDALRRGGAGSLQVPRWDRVGMVPRGLSEARSTPPPRPAAPRGLQPSLEVGGNLSKHALLLFLLFW